MKAPGRHGGAGFVLGSERRKNSGIRLPSADRWTKIRYAIGDCSLGSVLVAATERGICAIFLGDEPKELSSALKRRFAPTSLTEVDSKVETLLERVLSFVARPTKRVDFPLDLRGTTFQQRVWSALVEIPTGKTSSYLQIATAIGQPKAVRAVAQACASNPVAVLIPCHRVVRTDGAISGYRWGVKRKRQLLDWEATTLLGRGEPTSPVPPSRLRPD